MRNANKKIGILLATYNGELYLEAQLNSLLGQTHRNFLVIIRDDQSTDSTRAILEIFRKNHPDKIKILDSEHSNLGASRNFSFLVSYGVRFQTEFELDYFAFCDQDDIWHSEKIEKQLIFMTALESQFQVEKNLPVLVHSDLEVVNEKAQKIAESLICYQGLELSKGNFSGLLTSNLVTGCTAMFNPSLARLALPIPKEAIMHDWWIAIVASAFGKIGFIDETLVKYRQHAVNTLGAKPKPLKRISKFGGFIKILSPFRKIDKNFHLCCVAEQSKVFKRHYDNKLSKRLRLILWASIGMKTDNGTWQYFIYRLLRKLNMS